MGIRSPQEIWEAALGELQIQVSKPNFRTWFQKTSGLSYQNNQFTIGVPNSFVGEYLDKNQRSLIDKVLIGFTSPNVEVTFQINNNHNSTAGVNKKEMNLSSATGISSPKFNAKYIFDNYIEGSSNRLARAAAFAVANNPGQSYNPLFIYGNAGLGKTHLLHSIGQVALASHVHVVCVTAEQFTNEFVKAIRERNTEVFRNKYRNVGILLIDDIQFISGKEQTEESFFHTFNELHNSNRQLVITSDRPPKAMPHLTERLRSRFEWGLLVDIQPPDYETRLAILQAKSGHVEANIVSDVLELIAQNNNQNVRELEGSLNRVVAFAKLFNTQPTKELAVRALEDISSKSPDKTTITPDRLIEVTADCFQLSPDDLSGRKRDKETVLARRVAMYLIRQETNFSLLHIGQELGGRDAAAVANACKRITNDIRNDPYLARKLKDIHKVIAC
ncbi:chromosomal replication initiator protein DnaA [Chloroflexota bacterium]